MCRKPCCLKVGPAAAGSGNVLKTSLHPSPTDPTLPERIDRAGGTAAADTSVGSVGSFLTLLSRVLGGDPEVLRHTSDFIGLSNLTLYDEAFGNPPPAIFATLGPYEFAHREVEVLASKKAARTLRNASNKAQADKNSEDRESLLHRVKLLNDTVAVPGTTASMLGSSAELEDNDTIALGLGDVHPRGDPNSLPFSLLVTFRNPTNIQLDFLGTFMVDLKYADVTIANVTIPDMRLDANGSTAVMVYGYLRKIPGQEHILEQDVPKAVLRGMCMDVTFCRACP